MAQTYTRQSTFADGDTITAALFNDEYNQLVNAFAYSSSSASSTGHRHDGTAGQGGNIHTIGDLDFLNKIVVDSTNNRWGFYVEVSSAAVEQIRLQDGALLPVTDSDVDLGTTSLRFKDTFTDSITTTGNVDVGGNLTVTGTTTFNGGTITMGDAATDNVVFGADVDSSIIPDDDDTYDLGSSSQQWRNIFIDGTAEIDTLALDGTTVTSTAAELNILDGVTSSTAELNILDGVTSTTAELNILDGVTSTAAELNILDGVTATATELNLLDGVTSTTAELNILDGVTATAAEINALDGITSTVSELNIVDGDTSATSTTLADADRVVVNDNGTMVQVALTDFETYFESALDTLSNVTTVGALNAGSITSGFGAIDNGSSAITTTGTVTYGSLSDGTITITAFVDEDDMSSNSATLVPTQQSVKAYVDTQLTAEDLDVTTDSGTIAIDLDSETLTIGGTSNEIETSATGNAVTIGIPAAAQITTSLGIGGGSTNGVQISQGAISIKNGGTQSYVDFYCESSNAHYTRLQAAAHSAYSGNVTVTLPATTGTLALTSSNITGNAATATALATARTIHGVSFDGTANIDLTEVVQDTVGAMFSSNTETGIAATYEDGDGTIDLVIGSGVITNAMLAGSIANAKLANSSITVSDGSNSTATALGGTITFAGTSNEVEVAESSGTVTVGLPSNVTIGNNLTVTGNLTVSGTTTQTGPIVSDDNFTGLLNNNSGNSSDFGFFGKYVESSTTKYAGLYYDASTDNTFRLFADTQTEPAATVDTSATGYAAANLITAGITATTGTFSGAVSGTTGTFSGDLAVDTNVLKVDTSNNRIGVNEASPTVSVDLGTNTDAILIPKGTTAQRPSAEAGQFRYNTTTSQFEGYTDEWGAIAGGGAGSTSTFAKNTFAGDGSTTAFTLSTSMTSEDGLIVFIDGVYQADNVYSVSGTTLTFATAPVNGRVIEVFQLEGGIIGTAPSIDTMTGDGSDTTLSLSVTPTSENQTFVTIDGVVQHKDTYAISGSTLTFSAAPPTGTKVECITFSNVSIATFQDADGDTKIQVEESTDEDTIRMDIAGTEVLTLTNSAMTLKGTTPTLTIGDAGEEDTKIVFDGNTYDFHVGLDDTYDALIIGDGSTLGTNPIVTFRQNDIVTFGSVASDPMGISMQGYKLIIDTTGTNASLQLNGNLASRIDLGVAGSRKSVIYSDANNFLELSRNTNHPIAFKTNSTERARIDSSGNYMVGTTNVSIATQNSDLGVVLSPDGRIFATGDGHTDLNITSDGEIIRFRSAASQEGSITISGSSVSYNGFSGTHESSGIASNTVIGTVCSTIDELDTYVSGTKEGQTRTDHAKIKVSDTVGDARVYGVLSSYSEEDNKPIVASVGIGSVLVTGACEGGDLLESNGDGTAKVQDDDIIRSKTIGKVTIGNLDTNVKLVSCVLYCG